ncbi:hypothetical protein R3P38DRAFT_2791232 [Favolaschia claudopus]|uniref:Uncharacterized protein n=1 Tax=Favolaschia claudopus TaxID=2862362 RepID=A0AAW0AG99_9AGAR
MTTQILQCSTSLDSHTAVVEAQTSPHFSERNIAKTHSIWPKPVTLLEAYNNSLVTGANGQPIQNTSYVFKPDTLIPAGQPSGFSALIVPDLSPSQPQGTRLPLADARAGGNPASQVRGFAVGVLGVGVVGA